MQWKLSFNWLYILLIYILVIITNIVMLIIFTDVHGFAECYLCRHHVVYREDVIYENLKKKIEQINEGLYKNEVAVSVNKIVHLFYNSHERVHYKQISTTDDADLEAISTF